MSKKTIGLCVLLCGVTACIASALTVQYVTREFKLQTATTSTSIPNNASEPTTPSSGIQLPTLTEATGNASTTTIIDEATGNTSTTTIIDEATGSASSPSIIDETTAKSIALTHAGLAESDVSFVYCQLDYDDFRTEYEIEFYHDTTEYDYDIDATTGSIISYDYEMEHGVTVAQQPTTAQPASTSSINEATATSIALNHAGIAEADATALRCQLDLDDGIYEYEVEWRIGRTEYEYTILASDGTILEFDIDTD